MANMVELILNDNGYGNKARQKTTDNSKILGHCSKWSIPIRAQEQIGLIRY